MTEKEKKKEKKKKRNENRSSSYRKEEEDEEKTTYSLPSLSETPGALDRRYWESQETPVARTVLSASVCIAGYQRSGCRRG